MWFLCYARCCVYKTSYKSSKSDFVYSVVASAGTWRPWKVWFWFRPPPLFSPPFFSFPIPPRSGNFLTFLKIPDCRIWVSAQCWWNKIAFNSEISRAENVFSKSLNCKNKNETIFFYLSKGTEKKHYFLAFFLKFCLTAVCHGCCPEEKINNFFLVENLGASTISGPLNFVRPRYIVVTPVYLL